MTLAIVRGAHLNFEWVIDAWLPSLFQASVRAWKAPARPSTRGAPHLPVWEGKPRPETARSSRPNSARLMSMALQSQRRMVAFMVSRGQRGGDRVAPYDGPGSCSPAIPEPALQGPGGHSPTTQVDLPRTPPLAAHSHLHERRRACGRRGQDAGEEPWTRVLRALRHPDPRSATWS